MSLVGWVRSMLWHREPAPEVKEAAELRRRISDKADQLNSQLQTYQRARDPFAAFMADVYNRDQMSRLHRSVRP